MAGRRTLIRGGTVLTMDPSLGDLIGGAVLVDGGTRAAVSGWLLRPIQHPA